MRADAGFVAAHLLLAATGAALLFALGLTDARRVVAIAGPAYLAGAALTVPLLVLMLAIGVPFRTPTFVLLCLVLTAGLAALGVHRRREAAEPAPDGSPRSRIETAGLVAGAVGLAIWSVWAGRTFAHLPIQLDDARIWSLKSFALFYYDHLEPHIFTGAPYAASHLDYPIFQPVLHASIFRAMGGTSASAGHVELWILVVAFAWTIGWLLARPGRGVAWILPVALLLTASGIYTNVKLGYADVTYTCFLAAGALMVGRWIEHDQHAFLLLGSVLLGAAANVKNEGTVGALIIVACAGAVALAEPDRRARLRAWWPSVAIVAALAAPWRIWVAANGIHNSDQPAFHTAISPGYLIDRIDRARIALERLLEYITSGSWFMFFAALVVLAVVRLVARRGDRLAAFYLATAVLLAFSVVFAYWTSSLPVQFHLDTSIDRTVTGTLVVAGVGLAHLLGTPPTANPSTDRGEPA
jgi:hypothetical protein